MPSPRDRLTEVIARLTLAIAEYRRRENDPEYVLRPFAPAKESDIEKLETHIKRKLPPLYREFLLMHNGFRGLAWPGDMLSTTDVLPKGAWYEPMREWKKELAELGAGEVIGGVVIANLGAQSDWVYLDPEQPTDNGEWATVRQVGANTTVFADLIEYLEDTIEVCSLPSPEDEPDEETDESQSDEFEEMA